MKLNKKKFFRTIIGILLGLIFLCLLPDVTTVFYETRLENQKLETIKKVSETRKYLKSLYGDYMVEDDHDCNKHFRAYWK